MNMKKQKGIDFGLKKIFSKTILEVPEHVSVDFRGVIVKLYPVHCIPNLSPR